MLATFLRWSLPWACSFLLYGLTATPSNAEGLLTPQAAKEAQDFGAPVPLTQLADARGGSFQSYNQMTLNGTTSGNTAEHVMTGSNVIDAGAFDQMSGIPVVIQNSGANVLIQNALIVNLEMQ